MKKNAERKKGEKPFGSIAIAKGYCTAPEVEQALAVQRKLEAEGQGRVLLGIILVEQGIVSTTELIEILRDYEKE